MPSSVKPEAMSANPHKSDLVGLVVAEALLVWVIWRVAPRPFGGLALIAVVIGLLHGVVAALYQLFGPAAQVGLRGTALWLLITPLPVIVLSLFWPISGINLLLYVLAWTGTAALGKAFTKIGPSRS